MVIGELILMILIVFWFLEWWPFHPRYTDDNYYALWSPLRHNDVSKVWWAVFCGVTVKAKDSEGIFPLEFAVREGYSQMLSLLLDLGADPNESSSDDIAPVIDIAIARNHGEILKKLIEAGADVNIKYGEDETTPLRYAIDYDRYEFVELLLKAGAGITEEIEARIDYLKTKDKNSKYFKLIEIYKIRA